MSLFARSSSVIASTVRGLTTANPLKSPLTRFPFGISDMTFRSDAQNAYLATAAIFGISTCYAMHYPQIRFAIKKGREPGGDPWPDHPAQILLDNPNQDMSGADAALYNIIYVMLGGASHQYFYRNGAGQIIGYRPHSCEEIRPVPIGGGLLTRESWIDHYTYTPLEGGFPQPVPNTDVATLRFHSINPLKPQLSVSPFAAAFLDANTDSQITQFPLDLLKKGIFLSTIFKLAPESKDWEDSEFETTKAEINQQFGGHNKFSATVVRGGNDVQSAFPDFRKMDFAKLGERPEVRLCVAARADIVYVGFVAGLGTSTYDNVKLARIGFVKDSVVSLATAHARTLTGIFRRENWQGHPYGSGTGDFTIECDLSQVMALKDEEMDRQKQFTEGYAAGVVQKNEVRRTYNLPDDPNADNEYKQEAAPPVSTEPINPAETALS